MSSMHAQYRYSITCQTDELAVVYCLRSLADFAEKSSWKRIAWGGTNDNVWKQSGHCITLRFTSIQYRDVFRQKANELLSGRWCEVGSNDNDPATPKK